MGKTESKTDKEIGYELGIPNIHRVQSPSSINTFRQCPRKYFYHYIEQRPTKPSIHLVKGSVAHSVLEDFFDNGIIDEKEYKTILRTRASALLKTRWLSAGEQLKKMAITDEELHFSDLAIMVSNWLEDFLKKMEKEIATGKTPNEAFKVLTPIRERKYVHNGYAVQGFIDAIHEQDGKITVLDYKTSKRDDISDEYFLQLAIYALLYKHQHGKIPDQVGLVFLRHGEKTIEATENMVDHAIKEIKYVHENTTSKKLDDYPQKKSGLCKWSIGQCDFYEPCFER